MLRNKQKAESHYPQIIAQNCTLDIYSFNLNRC